MPVDVSGAVFVQASLLSDGTVALNIGPIMLVRI